MKFFIDKKVYNSYFFDKIYANSLSAIYFDYYHIRFYKNGKKHNSKNFAFINKNFYGCGEYFLNGKYYGREYDFTKKSWRRFVKLRALL